MNMVEKVARAMAQHQLTALGKAAMDDPKKDYYNKCYGKDERKNIEDLSRAAIEAMREPTQEMVDAANVPDAIILGGHRNLVSSDGWEAMIDAALKE